MFPFLLFILAIVGFSIVFVMTWHRCFYSKQAFRQVSKRISELELLIQESEQELQKDISPNFKKADEVVVLRLELENCVKIRDWLLELHPDYKYLT